MLCNIKSLPNSSLGRAVNKAWLTLKLLLDDENIWVDNNLIERSLLGPVSDRTPWIAIQSAGIVRRYSKNKNQCL